MRARRPASSDSRSKRISSRSFTTNAAPHQNQPEPHYDREFGGPADRQVEEIAKDDLDDEREEHHRDHRRGDVLRGAAARRRLRASCAALLAGALIFSSMPGHSLASWKPGKFLSMRAERRRPGCRSRGRVACGKSPPVRFAFQVLIGAPFGALSTAACRRLLLARGSSTASSSYTAGRSR